MTVDSKRNLVGWGSFILVLLAMVILAMAAATGGVLAQEKPPAAIGPQEVTADDVNRVAREIWCPLCSGVRLDSCELKACEQMKEVIAIKLGEGEDTASIQQYFLEQYGPEILGAPPMEGFNWLAWILPFAVLIGGGVFLWMRTQRMVRPSAAMADGHTHTTGEKDKYERRLEEELKKYG
jgi:cytochrome c-type biogenesis protein CcmH